MIFQSLAGEPGAVAETPEHKPSVDSERERVERMGLELQTTVHDDGPLELGLGRVRKWTGQHCLFMLFLPFPSRFFVIFCALKSASKVHLPKYVEGISLSKIPLAQVGPVGARSSRCSQFPNPNCSRVLICLSLAANELNEGQNCNP